MQFWAVIRAYCVDEKIRQLSLEMKDIETENEKNSG
jgi:hypothetical protein